jgi:hypothetical protein
VPSESKEPLRQTSSAKKRRGRKSLASTLRSVVSTKDFARRVMVGAVGTVALGWLSAEAAVAGLFISQALDGFVKELVEQRRVTKRKLWLVSLMLLLFDTGKRAFAATRRALRLKPAQESRRNAVDLPRRARWKAFAVTTAAASAVVATGFTAPELALGNSFWNRKTTFPIPRGEDGPPIDLRAPIVHVPPNLRIESFGAKSVRYVASARDARDGRVEHACEPPSGSTFAIGMTTVTCRASDSAGNTAVRNFIVTIIRIEDGVVWTIPGTMIAEARSSDGAVVTFPAAARRQDGTRLEVSCNPRSGSTFAIRRTVVRCTTATERRSFAVIVRDRRAPRLVVPDALVLGTVSNAGRAVAYAVSARDAVDGRVRPTCVPPPGATFPLGATQVRCTARDSRGNRAAETFAITLERSDDKEPPSLELHDAEVEATSPRGAAVRFEASAEDDRDGDRAVSCRPENGSVFAVGPTTVKCTASDRSGNTRRGTLVVTVKDTTSPDLDLPDDQTVEATSRRGATVGYKATARDVVDGAFTPECRPAAGATFPLGKTTVACSAVDKHGNRADGDFTVDVRDTTRPKLLLPQPLDVEATSRKGAAVKFDASATDAVDGRIAPACAPRSGTPFRFGTTTVTCKATDQAGNDSQDSFKVTVADTTAPVVTPPQDSTIEATGPTGVVYRLPRRFTATAIDSVDGQVPTSCPSVAAFPLGPTTITCTARDSHGNAGTATFTVTVEDTTRPTLQLPKDIAVDSDPKLTECTRPCAIVTFSASATDVVDGTIIPTCSPRSGSRFYAGTRMVTCTARDSHGNSARGRFKVTVRESRVPT